MNCYRCKDAKTDKCMTCRTNENLDVSIRHGASYPADLISASLPAKDTSTPTMTVPKACEDCPVLEVATALASLDPVTILLVVHRMRGGTLEEAGDWLADASRALYRWAGGMSRQTAHARLKGLKNPRLAKALHRVPRKAKRI